MPETGLRLARMACFCSLPGAVRAKGRGERDAGRALEVGQAVAGPGDEFGLGHLLAGAEDDDGIGRLAPTGGGTPTMATSATAG